MLIYRSVEGFKDGTDRIEYWSGMFFIISEDGDCNLASSIKKENCDMAVEKGLWSVEEVDEDFWTRNPLDNSSNPDSSGEYFAVWVTESFGVQGCAMHSARYNVDSDTWSVNFGEAKLSIPGKPSYYRKMS